MNIIETNRAEGLLHNQLKNKSDINIGENKMKYKFT